MDPSLALVKLTFLFHLLTTIQIFIIFQGFSCSTRSEWLDLLCRLQAMNEADKKQNSLFEVCTQRQTEWFPSSSNAELLEEAIALGML